MRDPVKFGLRLVMAAVAAGTLYVPLFACGGSNVVRAGMDVPTLEQYLQSPDPRDRRRAADGLAAARDPTAVPFLIDAVQRETHDGALGAELRALGYSGTPEAYQVIMAYMRHPRPSVARAANDAYRIWIQYRNWQGQPPPVAVPPPAPAPAPEAVAPPAAAPAPVVPPPAAPDQDDE